MPPVPQRNMSPDRQMVSPPDKKQRPLFPEDPLFLDMEWMDFLFYKHTSRCVSADYFRQRPTMV